MSPSNHLIIMSNSGEASAADLATADATKPANASPANATDAVAITTPADGGLPPCISRLEYGKKMHSLMTKQPTKVGKYLVGEKLISHRQSLYDKMKARKPTIYTRDGPSQLLTTTRKSETKADDSDSNGTPRSDTDRVASVVPRSQFPKNNKEKKKKQNKNYPWQHPTTLTPVPTHHEHGSFVSSYNIGPTFVLPIY